MGVAGHRGASTGTKAAAEFDPEAMDFLALSVPTYEGTEKVQTPIPGRNARSGFSVVRGFV
jgi:hypothetical protein